MHEVAIARQIANLAAEHARALGYPSVRAISVQIGAWTCINPDLLRRAFEGVVAASGIQPIRLDLETVEPECRCRKCGKAFRSESFQLRCASCGSSSVVLEKGREMVVRSVEV